MIDPASLAAYLRLEPFPHCVLPLAENLYRYCEANWVPVPGPPGARTNAPVENNRITRALAALAGSALEVFTPALKQAYPAWSPGPRRVRVLWSSNKASSKAFAARDWHLDRGRKLVVGLWYFRAPGDHAGGDLLLRSSAEMKATRIRYERNLAVLFPNLPWAWHAVSKRSPSSNERRFINILLEQERPLHDYARGIDGEDIVRPVQNHFGRANAP